MTTEFVVMGRVMAPYGVRGWIKARAFTASPEGLLAYRSWWLAEGQNEWREFAVLEARMHAGSIVARLEGLNRRDDAAAWRGAEIGVPRASLPRLGSDEFYLRDLIGFTVVNRAGAMLGRVNDVLDAKPHPVLRVGSDTGRDGRERLIPLVPAYVDAIDAAGGRILVDWQPDY